MNPFQPPRELLDAVRKLRDAHQRRAHLSVSDLIEIHTTLERHRAEATGPIRRWLDEHHAVYVAGDSHGDSAAATDRLADRLRLPPYLQEGRGLEQLSLFDLSPPASTAAMTTRGRL